MLFNVFTGNHLDVRMLSAKMTDFHYSALSGDKSDSVTIRAKLLKKTAKGFRFSWSVVHSSHDRVVARLRRTVLVPWTVDWGPAKVLECVPGYYAKCFYSDIPIAPGPPVKLY